MNKIIAIALKEVGTTELPANSNKTKYGKWFGLDGQAWCGMFVSWCYAQAGVLMPKIGFAKPGFAGCQSAYAYFEKNKMITNDPRIGDVVLFDWTGDGHYDHTGIFNGDIDSEHFRTIEGNTAVGNDSNGGSVMVRARNYKNAIFIRIPGNDIAEEEKKPIA